MNYHLCEDCGLEIDPKSAEILSKHPAYIYTDEHLEECTANKNLVLIIHATCFSTVGDKLLEKSGDLLLVQRDFKAIYD